MVKRVPPLALAVIGTGEASAKNVEALLTDYTSPYADVTFVLPVDDEHWTPTISAVYDWVTTNDIPFIAVTDGTSPSKHLVTVLDAAAETIKVARVSTKLVQLLKQQKEEGEEAALLVAWNDDDNEAVLAVNKALTAEVTALNLLDGLDEFSFEDGDPEEGEEAPAASTSEKGEGAAYEEPEDEPVEASGGKAGAPVGDEYDDFGVRKLRQLLRDRKDDHDIPDRTIGQLEKDDCIRALRNIDQGRGKVATKEAEAAGARVDGETAEEPVAESRKVADAIKADQTNRARRAFAEGASEGSGKAPEEVELPTTPEGDLLAAQSGGTLEEEVAHAHAAQESPQATVDVSFAEDALRARALELAITSGSKGADAIADAMKYEVYLRGQRQSAGRPRSDGSPAQPREIGEDGKAIRRRAPRSTE